jgi:hypothetical protein
LVPPSLFLTIACFVRDDSRKIFLLRAMPRVDNAGTGNNKNCVPENVHCPTVITLLISQLACFLLAGAFVVEKLFIAVTHVADGYEDDAGFHWKEPGHAETYGPSTVGPLAISIF